jgi:hypothetical protein
MVFVGEIRMLTQIQVTPESDPRDMTDDFGGQDPHIFHRRRNSDSDPDEGDIEEYTRQGPGGTFMHRIIYGSPAAARDGAPAPGGARRPVDPTDGEAIFQRFQEMLNGFSGGQAGRSGPDTLFPPDGRSPNVVHTTFRGPGFSGGTTSFTIATGPIGRPEMRGRPPGSDFDAVFGNMLPRIPPPGFRAAGEHHHGQDHGPGSPPLPDFPIALQQLLGALLNPNPASAVYGDHVATQEAMDRIISQLMEANPQSNAAPAASQGALDQLQRKKADDEIMNSGEGKAAECTICLTEVSRGEDVVILPCKHWFHDECGVMWLKQHNTCPVCRHPIEGSGDNAADGSRSRSAPPQQSPTEPAQPSLFSTAYRRREMPDRARSAEQQRRLDSIRTAAGEGNYSGYAGSSPTAERWHQGGTSQRPTSSSRHQDEPYGSRYQGSGGARERERSSGQSDGQRDGQGSRGWFGSIRDHFSRHNNGSGQDGRRRS